MRAFMEFLGTNDMMAYLSMMAPRLVELRRVQAHRLPLPPLRPHRLAFGKLMAQPLRKINHLLSSIESTGKLEEEKLIALVVSIRRLIESEAKQTAFPIVWFYCNWCLHSQIERGLVKSWLARISKAMGEVRNLRYSEEIAATMALDQLRVEFLQLFRTKHLPVFLFESPSN